MYRQRPPARRYSSWDCPRLLSSLFFFTDPATTEIYTLSLHDALPILRQDLVSVSERELPRATRDGRGEEDPGSSDRKSTRLNSSHRTISYAVFCLKKKKKKRKSRHTIKTTTRESEQHPITMM